MNYLGANLGDNHAENTISYPEAEAEQMSQTI